MEWMKAYSVPSRSATELRDLLNAELDAFRSGAEMSDDQAFLVLSEENTASSPSVMRRRRIGAQPGSFLFPSNS